jgi:hypothetical protein
MLVATDTDESLSRLFGILRKRFPVVDLGQPTFFAGYDISYDNDSGQLRLSQKEYIASALRLANMSECRPQSTPADANHSLLPSPPDAKSIDFPFRSVLGLLLYVLGSRPDIAVSVNAISRHQEHPSEQHVVALKRVLRYLAGTARLELNLTPSASVHDTGLTTYADATWADDLSDRSSTTGWIVFYLGCPVSWCTRKQHAVAKSSAEAEYVSLSDASSETVWFRQLLRDCHQEQLKPSVILEDNEGAIGIAENTRSLGRAKHIDVRYHFVKQFVSDGTLVVRHVPTTEQVADALTKPLPAPAFLRHRAAMRLIEP